MRCAICCKEGELLLSAKSNGVQQPRICKKCMIKNLSEGEQPIHDDIWIEQIMSLPDGKEQLQRILKI